ncbi:sulfatase-like hydrolase/transferase [Mariniblastus fucicola]|uniref:Choline-sulfatase n=1 Tax=Mariniblastus fucicola TaxID=980251 RepID=A0A5B9P9M3_9BACT|nr:sulfatase-like hydrolase/transferase [Mariniblastus fucicola]QEG21316.1 Choline-sulfatase [Mariniblastus fucicola]
MKPFSVVSSAILFLVAFHATGSAQQPARRPNIILIYADDISARELPLYESSVWSKPTKGDTSDVKFRAKTPAIEQMAREGCWIKTAWASVVCSPSRAMMMTGRYAHLHKWWNNKDKGRWINPDNGKPQTWPLYESSPLQIGHVAQQAGYATYWSGKTQMAGDLQRFGFDQGCFTPGQLSDTDNPYTDFKMIQKKVDGQRQVFSCDTGERLDTYQQHGWYWMPHVRLMNHGGKKFQWWPNSPESEKSYGLATWGPDVELDFVFDFMDQQAANEKPFFVYHTTHLGHDGFDFLHPDSKSSWPGTPILSWDGSSYKRTEPHVTGDKGVYDDHGTITEPGIHKHIEYLDYQVWQYRNKLEELGIADDTVIIFCADNGTSGYGKNSPDRQKGVHVPMVIYAPGMTKQGRQDVLVNMSDLLPTIADLSGFKVPSDYEVNGQNLVPFLYGEQTEHRDWIYAYSFEKQLIRGDLVMKDGREKWWDVSETPDDLISYRQIKDWSSVSAAHRAERDLLLAQLPQFDLHATQHDAPGVDLPPTKRRQGNAKSGKTKKSGATASKKVLFADDFDSRTEVGEGYSLGRFSEGAFEIVDGVLVTKQVSDKHGSVIRKGLKFKNVDVEFDVRFSGGKSFNFVFDDAREQSVHAGHICRVSMSPKWINVRDDKTGVMKNEIRAKRKSADLSATEKAELEKLIASKQSSGKLKLKANEWHRVRLLLNGSKLEAFIDGQSVASLDSPGIGHATKTKLGMTINGGTIDFDNLKIYSVAN